MRITIAGGGVGGMMSALLLAKEGYEVTLIEKEDKLGGRLAFVERDGYRIDKGPTIVLLPEMFKSLLAEAGIDEHQYELIKCDPLYDLHFANGNTYTKYADMNEQLEEIKRVFPEDYEAFKRFMKDMEYRFNEGKPRFLEQSFLNRWEAMAPGTLNSLRKLKAFRSVIKQLDHYFQHDDMKVAYALQTLYIGGNPYTTPAIYSLVSFSEHKHGIYYVKGGYASLIPLFEQAMEKMGVKVLKNTPLERVTIKEDKITAYQINGEEFPVDAMVLNGDFPVADQLVKKTQRTYQPSSGCLLLYMGVDHQFDERNVHQFYLSRDFQLTMKEVFKDRVIPTDPSYYVFNPSIIDPSLAPEGKSALYVLVPVPSGETIDWESEKDALAERILDSMERNGFSGLREKMEWLQIRTPKEAMTEGLYQGGSFGIAPTLFQSGPFRPQFQPYPEVANLFAVGASVHPGGGVPIVMQGAKLLADGIIRKKRKEGAAHDEALRGIRSV